MMRRERQCASCQEEVEEIDRCSYQMACMREQMETTLRGSVRASSAKHAGADDVEESYRKVASPVA
eukprot:6102100-Pleurochrysis_carterae.AAC.4